MVWHFFKKDVRLLWPVALAVVLAQVLCAVRTAMLGYFDQPPVLERLTVFLPLLVYLGIVVVAVTVVQQEPLSGVREDWLIRPIRRRDLAISKAVFVLLLVNLPIALVDVAQQLALNFPLSVSIGAALSRSSVIVFAISLPALLLGAVTRSLTEAFVFGIAAAIGIAFLFAVATSAMSPALFEIGGQSGMTWISMGAAGLVMLLGGAATLAFQYSARRSLAARILGLATVLIALCTFVCLPKPMVIALQESLWRSAGSSSEVKLTLDTSHQAGPAAPRMALSYVNVSTAPAAVVAAREAEKVRIDRQMQTIRLPLRIAGMHPGDILIADRVAVRIMAATGKVLYRGAGVCTRGGTGVGISCSDNGLEVWASAAQSGDVPSEQRVNLPIAVFERIKDEPVSMDVTYVLTRLVPRSPRAISATGELLLLPEMGSCATRIDTDGDEVELGCLTNVGVPSCAAAVLEDPQTHKRNPELHVCGPNYGPFHRVGLEAAVSHSRLSIPFLDRTGLVHYPVDSTAISRARILLTVYDPVDHFHATLTVPSIRLVEWQLRE
jgi:hypothetical protein